MRPLAALLLLGWTSPGWAGEPVIGGSIGANARVGVLDCNGRPDDCPLLEFQDLGDERGRCYLNCHGEEHDPKEYVGNDEL